jgi:cyclic-di-GMP-binding protein
MLGFLRLARPRDSLELVLKDESRGWLNTVGGADTTAAAYALVDRLIALNAANFQFRLRLRLMDMFSEQAAKLLPVLEQRFTTATPPLTGKAREAAYLAEKLYKELAAGYSILVLRPPPLWPGAAFRQQVLPPLVRAMECHAQRLALSEQLYAPDPKGVWLALHRLFGKARDWKIAHHEDARLISPTSVYRDALLLSFAQPQQFGPGDCKRVQNYLKQHGSLALLYPPPRGLDGPGLFLIGTRGDTSGTAYEKSVKSDPGALVLDTSGLLDAIHSELRALRLAAKQANLSAQAYRLDFLQRLADHWRGRRLQRAIRTRFHPRAEVWLGLSQIWHLLLDMKRGARVPPPSAGRWVIRNESARGFALKFISGAAPAIAVGEVLALRPDGRAKLHLCVVRWIVSRGPDHLELGIEQLAPVVIPAAYKKPGKTPMPPNAVLYLPTMPGPQQSALLVAEPALVNTTRAVELRHANGRLALHATRIAETTASVQLIEVVLA